MRWRRGGGDDSVPAGANGEVEALLEASPFRSRPRSWLSLGPTLPIVEIEVTGQDALRSFDVIAEYLPGGWDRVVVTRWGPDDPDDVQRQLRRREEFEGSHEAGFGPEPATFEPDDLIETASRWTDADLERRFDALEADRDLMRHWPRGEVLDLHLAATARALGAAPGPGDVPASIDTEAALDRWLLTWELAHGSPPRDHVQDWFDPRDQPVLIRAFPRTAPFAALAIDHWWASEVPFTLAATQRWHRRYGARLVAHFGTMLEILATKCPPDVDEAWSLAREQHLLCDSLLEPSGETRRHLALGLMEQTKWFLHSRP